MPQRRHETVRPVARVSSPKSGRVMEVLSDQPGVQFYTGNFMDGSTTGKGVQHVQHSAFCLETQRFPDSINKKEWREFQRYKRNQQSPESKFYKHLTWYIAIMGFFLYKNHGNIFGFFPIAFFWGIGLVVHYFSVFGWPNEQTKKPEQEEDNIDDALEDKGPSWSDKDLV